MLHPYEIIHVAYHKSNKYRSVRAGSESMFDVCEEMSHLERWQRWMPPRRVFEKWDREGGEGLMSSST